MVTGSFSIFVEYAQILVFIASHPAPGLLWEDDHVSQGFAWSEGLVSFGVPDHDDECLLNISREEKVSIDESALWAVQTPFIVSEPLEIGTVLDTRKMQVPYGTYNLIFEALPATDLYSYVINLKFVESNEPEFAVLKKGQEITTDNILRREAELANK
jgi:hypothetical protein